MSTGASLLAALGSTAALAALHLSAPRLRRLPGLSEAAVTSFAGGLAVAYVFLHLLPELGRGNEAIRRELGDELRTTLLTEVAIFLVALVGFAAFYGMERLARARSDKGRGEGGGSTGVFTVHLLAYAVYNGIITYSMPLRYRTGVAFAMLFTAAMGLHFVLNDRSLAEHWPRRFDLRARAVVVAGLGAGWLLVLVAAPTSTLVVAVLIALLGGSVLMNVFKEELPAGEGRSSYGWFLAGLIVYAALILAATAVQGDHGEGGKAQGKARAATSPPQARPFPSSALPALPR